MAIDPEKIWTMTHELQALLGQVKHLATRYKKGRVLVAEKSLRFDDEALTDMKGRLVELRDQITDAFVALRDELPDKL